ncbi:hypothetical protein AQUCO_00300827v1 [Aquilegia coerulea]|uniref:KIB1-4 beta-propeller domain-containing protein n=1 Tax=Aquilegia coerulea TaxID=218851 RepID=A0A2G5F0S3_AQUCA|nr:hypothetical protein AQUCO_00300827v1 [Aquilegia coerulea]
MLFYNLTEKKVYNFPLPVPHDRYYRGFSQAVVHLLNLFNNNQNLLPPLSTFDPVKNPTDPLDDDGCIHRAVLLKVVLSANPTLNPNNYVVIAIFGSYSKMAFYKPGDDAWTSLDIKPSSKNQAWIQARELSDRPASLQQDVIYYKNKFYAVDFFGALWVYGLSVPHPRLYNMVPSHDNQFYHLKYIVQSCGHLLLVGRNCPMLDVETKKLDWYDLKWVETKNLCGQMLFLGDNESLSLSASDYPGCKQNHIYFTDNYLDRYYSGECPGPPDMGVYNLEDGTVEPHYQVTQFKRFLPAPVWIEPTLGIYQMKLHVLYFF